MNYSFPEARFARELSIEQQVAHLFSEVDEVAEHGPEISREMLLEAMDLLHSCETLFRIVERVYGPDYVDQMRLETIGKNAGRGYYGG